jgi:hypothetical protein
MLRNAPVFNLIPAVARRKERLENVAGYSRVHQLNPRKYGLIERPDAYPWAALPLTGEATRHLLKKSLVPFNKLLGY